MIGAQHRKRAAIGADTMLDSDDGDVQADEGTDDAESDLGRRKSKASSTKRDDKLFR